MTSQETDTRGPLSGVRILDMATVFAAPFGATLCADHGADVLKLELPNGSDPLRGLQPVKDGVPLWWKIANRGKRGITLDVRKPAGREILLRMLPEFDVLVENFRTGTMDKWGLDINTLHQANPRLIVVRLTGFGQTGPYSGRPGFARNFPSGEAVAGLFCAVSIAAEVARARSAPQAKGVEVDLSATEALFRLLDFLPVEHEQLGFVRRATGNCATYTAPSNMYCSSDGVWFSLVASSESIFARLCNGLGHPEWIEDPRFSTNPRRVANLDQLNEVLERSFSKQSFAILADRLEQAGVPFSKIYTIRDIEHDPQFIARRAIVRLPDPDYGSLPAPCIVPRVKGRDLPIPRTGPSVGEHNAQVYANLGIQKKDLDMLRREGIV